MTEKSKLLYINEIFLSIQGESSFAGLPFAFVRLAGCNLDCSWCDSPAAKQRENARCISVEDVLRRVRALGVRHVCITGGEPLLQAPVHVLMDKLLLEGKIVTLETNGSMDITGVNPEVHRIVDVKCPGSGMAHRNQLENLAELTPRDEVKFVIADVRDYRWAKQIVADRLEQFAGAVFFSPVWEVLSPETLARWVVCDKVNVRVHLQLHKLLGMR